jgi:hypothetical protein
LMHLSAASAVFLNTAAEVLEKRGLRFILELVSSTLYH